MTLYFCSSFVAEIEVKIQFLSVYLLISRRSNYCIGFNHQNTLSNNMLQTDDVDDDYFTPVSSTSLANIFGNKTKVEEGKENESLKYTPPKPQTVAVKPEETKATQCVFACALYGYEWLNNEYIAKGKLGFAILKIIKTGFHNIVLYDSNKTTLSCTTITPDLEVTFKENVYISYYDNQRKYWNIYGTAEELTKIVDYLKNFNIYVKYKNDNECTDEGPPEPGKTDEKHSEVVIDQPDRGNKESDTDSSVHKKTKLSILTRMANMGHSVLPPQSISIERTSDSSDTNEIITQPKTVRHKPIKNIVKRTVPEKNPTEIQGVIETHQKAIVPHKNDQSVENIPLYTYVNGNLVPVTNSSMMINNSPQTSNEMNLFMSEQRISNSELRINTNRLTDKIDQVLDKISNLEKSKTSGDGNFQTEILQKLLSEYENKIKIYEQLIQSKGIQCNTLSISSQNVENTKHSDIEAFRHKIREVEQENKSKENEISNLSAHISMLQERLTEITEGAKAKEDTLKNEITSIKQELLCKDEQMTELTEKYENLLTKSNESNLDINSKIKSIMNETFQAITNNFENDENYSGDAIKNLIGIVIKKVTIESLKDLK